MATELQPQKADAYSPSEMMAYRACQELQDGDIVFVGIGLPNLACNLARAMHAPELFMIYESGAVGALPERLPVSIGDPALVTGAVSVVGMADIFQNYLQGGCIEVGFLGGAQVDRYGNINTTVIGEDYKNPKVRLPGSGGACEIAVHAKKLLLMMKMSPKAFVEKCDFITSPGNRRDAQSPHRSESSSLPGAGPSRMITDRCVFDFIDGEMHLSELYPGESVESVRAQCGWSDLKVCAQIKELSPPPEQALQIIRSRLDPQQLYT